MKIRCVINVLLVACLVLGGCERAVVQPKAIEEVRSGIFVGNDPADFPFPTSGYNVYLVGETHGNQETKIVFGTFLNNLYQGTGLRDVILEEDQAYEADANAYVHGRATELIDSLCMRADILGQIREFNANLPNDQKVSVHLVDVDSPLPAIYKHLTSLHQQLGPAGKEIILPEFSDFNTWVPRQRSELVEELKKAAAQQPGALEELDSVNLSLRWYNLGNRLDIGSVSGLPKNFAPLREDIITKNVQYVLSQLDGKPVLSFFGLGHGMKVQASPFSPAKDIKSWAQRLIEEGVSVYSVGIFGLSGEGYWHGEAFEYEVEGEQQYSGADGFRFEDSTPLPSLFQAHPGFEILYADLRVADNASVQLPSSFLDIPASQVYDGLIIYKIFTPLENKCRP